MKLFLSIALQIAALLASLASLQVEAQSDQQSDAVPIATYCPNIDEVLAGRSFFEAFMRAAIKARAVAGEAAVTFTVTKDNKNIDIAAREASHPAFADAAIATVRQLKCESGGRELHLKIPLAFKLESPSTQSSDPDDIQTDDFPRVIPLIAELRTEQTRFALKSGEGLKISNLKVLAFDASGKFLGRLRQSDRDAQPRSVLVFRNADIVQATQPGAGYIEMSAPQWSKYGSGRVKPTVRVEITVVD